jgi:hypothetical protein
MTSNHRNLASLYLRPSFSFVIILVSPLTAIARPQAQLAWRPRWKRTLEATKKDGRVVVWGPARRADLRRDDARIQKIIPRRGEQDERDFADPTTRTDLVFATTLKTPLVLAEPNRGERQT